jgi:Domain of unknown function (DUF6378)
MTIRKMPFVQVKKRGRPAKEAPKPVDKFPSIKAIVLAEAAKPTLAAVLAERGSRYGTFQGHANVTQDFKRLLKKHLDSRNKVLTDTQQEALEMVFHKIGRIVNGDANYDDSWVDVAGYSKLVADELQGNIR